MKKLSLLTLLVSAATLASCGGGNGGTANCSVTPEAKEAKVQNAFITQAKLTYNNMRPQYNYYLTTFSFQELELYDNNTYKLSISSSTFTAIELPVEGNAAKGNENANSLISYMGKFTSKVDELDDKTLAVTFEAPTRIFGTSDENGFIDTDNWTSTMKEHWTDKVMGVNEQGTGMVVKSETKYDTGAAYLAARTITIKSTYASTDTGIMDWIDVTNQLKA